MLAWTLSPRGRLIDLGGDWDRRNRLKVYRATFFMATRDLHKAADLLLVRRLGVLLHVSSTTCQLCISYSAFQLCASYSTRQHCATSAACPSHQGVCLPKRRHVCVECFGVCPCALQESVATFTCTEMFSFTALVCQAVLLGVYSLPRTALKKRVLDSPDVLAAIRDVPNLSEFVSSLYDCNYRLFFESLGEYLLRGMWRGTGCIRLCQRSSSWLPGLVFLMRHRSGGGDVHHRWQIARDNWFS